MVRHDEKKERIEPWHIDSAMSNHMTGEEDLFVEMEKSKGDVTFGDESKALVLGGGGKKYKSNVRVTIGSSFNYGFIFLSEVADTIRTQDGGLNGSNTVTDGSIGQVSKATVVPSGMPNATSASRNAGTPNELLKQVVNRMDKGKGGSSRGDDEGFIEVKKKKSSGNNEGNKNFKLVSVKPKTQYRPNTHYHPKDDSFYDWNSPEFQDTANSGQKKAMVFYQMDTEEVSDRFVAPCFVNGLEAYDGEINLGVEENMISNEYAVKLCLEHEVKRGNKVVKKELIVALRGEIYFVKFIINPEEDDVEPGVIFGRLFLRLTKAITDFGVGTVTIYPDIDPFLEETEEEEKSNDDWDHLLDFKIDDVPLLGEEGLPPFVCKMGKSSRNKKRAMENLNFFYQDIGTSSSADGHLTQEEAAKEAIAIRMSQKFTLLEEERPIIETMAYHDKYKKILDEVWKDKVELDGKIVKEEEEEVKRIKGEALKEKYDPRAFIFPIRLQGQVGVTTLIAKFLILDIPIDCDSPIVVGCGFLRTIGGIVNAPKRLFSTFNGFSHQTFRAARSNVMRNAKSDSDDEEEYEIKRNKFGAPIYGPKPAPYLNCNDPDERSLAILTVTNPFRKISIWKKAVSFLGSLPVPLKQVNWKPDYKGSYTKEEEATGQWRAEIRLTDPLKEHTIMRPDHQDPNAQDNMKPWKRYCFHKFTTSFCYGKDVAEMQSLEIDDMLRIRLREAGSDEEIFTSSKKIIKFRLGGRAHSLTLLEFAIRLGLYQAVELKEEGFNVYFEGGLRNDDNFNAQDYWTTGYDKIQKYDLWLLSMFDARHQNGYANVAWVIARWMKRKGAGTQKESQIFYAGCIIDLIDFEGKLIPEDPQSGVPRVGIPRPPRASMQDLYDRMGRMEIRQEAIEQMEYRQSYHWDRKKKEKKDAKQK
ncbi:hypothetical protein Tco_0963713 [Tanacetum coccineum]